MKESYRKSLLYFQPIRTYWKRTKGLKSNALHQNLVGFYPQSIAPRIEQGHYLYFDEDGIPCYPNFQGVLIHHYTTMCSYALGLWEQFLQSDKNSPDPVFLKIADYLVKTVIQKDGLWLFLDLEEDGKEVGIPCAMNQGEAMSVLIRAHALTNDTVYLNLAKNVAKAFSVDFDKGGIRGYQENGSAWYLEAGKLILNGHCYAVMGLMELADYTQDEQIQQLFQIGVNSVAQSLAEYDTGNWSYYWTNRPLYVASIMYHNLHIVHLEILGERTQNQVLLKYAKRFEQYAANPFKRIQAIKDLVASKKQLGSI